MIALLAPIFQGALAPLGEALRCSVPPPADAVRLADLVGQPSLLCDVLGRHARGRRTEGGDRRAIASMWLLDYAATLLPPVVAAASVLHHVFPVGQDETWLQLDAEGAPRRFHVVQLGARLPDAPASLRYAPLLDGHLGPLVRALATLTGVAPKILWGNVARRLEPILDQALTMTAGAASIARDRQHLLGEAAWETSHGAMQRDNPLHGTQRVVRLFQEGHEVRFKLHRQCCLCHLLPSETYCRACPLAPAYAKDRS